MTNVARCRESPIGGRVGSWALGHLLGLAAAVVLAGSGTGQAGQDAGKAPAPTAPMPSPARIEQFAPPDEFLLVGAIKTHHITRGDRGRPIVLIHGFGSSTYTWRRNLDGLARTCRVYALDLKGFGLTAKPRDGRYHIPAYAEHLLGYLDAMKLERPVLVGNSMGGAVAAHLALNHPGRVAGLILVDPAPVSSRAGSGRAGRPRAGPVGLPEAPAGNPQGPLAPALFRTLITRPAIERWLKATYHDPSLVTREMIETYYRPITIEGATEALAAMMNPPTEAMPERPPLSSLKVPVLVLWGRFDRVVPRTAAEDYVRSIPGSRLLVFDHSGHLPHEEEPERFRREVMTFVDRL